MITITLYIKGQIKIIEAESLKGINMNQVVNFKSKDLFWYNARYFE